MTRIDKTKEIGGYIELDTYRLPMLHEEAIALNCGRNAVGYLIEARQIHRICMPIFMCESVKNLIRKYGIELCFYHINEQFEPIDPRIDEDTWIYVVNFYGQLTGSRLEAICNRYPHVILDNCHAYFSKPIEGIDTLYSCRKNLGVPDGAFLYTDAILSRELPQEKSYNRMNYLLGRFEGSASDFYAESAQNNEFFIEEELMEMSKLTKNLLHGIDYDDIRRRRSENFAYLCNAFEGRNLLHIVPAEGGFMFPLMIEHAQEIRRILQKQKIYIPLLWPNVLEEAEDGSVDYRLSHDVLPLPCDQRYNLEDMQTIVDAVLEAIESMEDLWNVLEEQE